MKPLLFKDQLSLRHDVFNLDVCLRSCLTLPAHRPRDVIEVERDDTHSGLLLPMVLLNLHLFKIFLSLSPSGVILVIHERPLIFRQ